jgi:hypothetical protein
MDSTLGTIIATLALMSLLALSAQVVAFVRSNHR